MPSSPPNQQNAVVRYFALACDYDGTAAHGGSVAESTLAAIKRVAASGRKLVLVTGRRLEDLLSTFPEIGVFDRVVAENGALIYRPASRETRVLAPPPSPAFVAALLAAEIEPLSIGHSIVATWEPNDKVVHDVIRELGLELQVVYNKGAVMVLPSGVNKSSGLLAALLELGLSPHNTVAIGDAENDHAFLNACGCAVAVQNAIPTLKEQADITMEGCQGAGVEQLCERLLKDDLRDVVITRQGLRVLLGEIEQTPVYLPSDAKAVLIAGPSGSGKSTLVHGLLQSILENNFQLCLVDPEGDYAEVDKIVKLGSATRPPELSEVTDALGDPSLSVGINLLGMPLNDRPRFLNALLPRIQELKSQTGRPHWTIFDEAHHLMPSSWAASPIGATLTNSILVTVSPESLATSALKSVGTIVAVGPSPETTIGNFASAAGVLAPSTICPQRSEGETPVWITAEPEPICVRVVVPAKEIRRHKRKYATGQLGEDRSFYFRGHDGKLNLQAQNLQIFIQMAKGIDDETWMYHLRRKDYSRWVFECIKDNNLGGDLQKIEENDSVSPEASRDQVIEAIQTHYTAGEKGTP